MKKTRKHYEEYLNELGISEGDKKSNGGLIPDHLNYGTWLRRNQPVTFNVGYNEWQRN